MKDSDKNVEKKKDMVGIQYEVNPFMRECFDPDVREVIIKKGCSLGYSSTIETTNKENKLCQF